MSFIFQHSGHPIRNLLQKPTEHAHGPLRPSCDIVSQEDTAPTVQGGRDAYKKLLTGGVAASMADRSRLERRYRLDGLIASSLGLRHAPDSSISADLGLSKELIEALARLRRANTH